MVATASLLQWKCDIATGACRPTPLVYSAFYGVFNWWINRVPAVTTAGVRVEEAASDGLQVTLCDVIWHARSRNGVLLAQLLYAFFTFT